jgi:lipoprotein-releasing system ATP-binding protein
MSNQDLERVLNKPAPKLRATPVPPRLRVVAQAEEPVPEPEAKVAEPHVPTPDLPHTPKPTLAQIPIPHPPHASTPAPASPQVAASPAPAAATPTPPTNATPAPSAIKPAWTPTLHVTTAEPVTVRRFDPPRGAETRIPQEQLATVNLFKSYRKGANEVPVLQGVSMHVRQGEFLAIVGQSGSGKSTLLHLLGTLDVPDRGEIYYGGRRIDNLNARGRDALRNRQFGMIFQFYHLLPELTTLENVLSPLMIAHGALSYFANRRQHRKKAEELLAMVGLTHRLKHRPRELSGGEMQRAAIARALVTSPDLLLADEPTGNLDQGTGQEIIRILRTLNRQRNLTIVMVTHDLAVAEQADRTVRLKSGRIEE